MMTDERRAERHPELWAESLKAVTAAGQALRDAERAVETRRRELRTAVAIARTSGATFAEIGEALDVSSQRAHQLSKGGR